MLGKVIDISQFWKLSDGWQLMDVRTPAEWEKGHMEGALNFPLFDNEERAVVGTTYKQQSPYQAMLKGLEFAGPKMADFVQKANELAPSGKLVLYCWRGGKRSSSMAWLLEQAGFEVQLILGGYKAYRKYVRQQLETLPYRLIVLGGRTGCGKTEILHAIRAQGEQVIDLEGLAHHRGSAFGALGEAAQPSVEAFENQLFHQVRKLDLNREIWVENESRKIGKIYIQEGFWARMKAAPLINIELPFEQRLTNLVATYADYPEEELAASFFKIRKRLGPQHFKAAIQALKEQDFSAAAAIALQYYDKSYQFLLANNAAPAIHTIQLSTASPDESARQLIEFRQSEGFQTTG